MALPTDSTGAPTTSLPANQRETLMRMAPLMVVSGLSAISLGIFSVALPLYTLSLGASPAEWGFITSAGVFSMFVFEPVWGILSDRLGVRSLLITTRFALAATSIVFLTEPGLFALYFLQFARASFEAPVWPLAKAYIGVVIPRAAKGTYLGLFYGCMGIGTATGAAMAGFAIAGGGYGLTFGLCVAFTLVASLSSLIIKAEPKAAAGEAQTEIEDGVSEFGQPAARSTYVWPFAALSMVSIFALAGWSGAQTFLPIVASDSLHLSAEEVGIILTVANLGNAFLMLPAGYVADRKGRKPAIVAGLLICALAMVGFAWATGFWALLLPVIALSGGRTMPQAARVALLSDLMPGGRQGLVMGLIGAIEDAGVMLGTAGGGLLWGLWGREGTYAMFLVSQLVGIVLCLALIKEREWIGRLTRARAGLQAS